MSLWLRTHVASSEAPEDVELMALVRAALPGVGFVWTKNGARRGTTPVDRVLARSESKPVAAADIVAAEFDVLGERCRALVLCDHERATATVPLTLAGVMDAEAGSAFACLQRLLDDPRTAPLRPLMVTGSTVAADASTLEEFIAFAAEREPRLAGALAVAAPDPLDGRSVATASTGWSSRTWVRHATAWFEQGRSQVLVGTRGLLGEGWNARRISTLVDLTSATSLTAVVQTRGRALRVDPSWPEKVAANWTVVCVSEDHPKGDADWRRLVRKHEGFHGIDPQGDVVDGVAHIHPSFSPFRPPPVGEFDRINTEMRSHAAAREEIRDAWRVGEPYRDVTWTAVRVRSDAAARRPEPEGSAVVPAAPLLRVDGSGVLLRENADVPDAAAGGGSGALWTAAATAATAAGGALAVGPGAAVAAGLGTVAVGLGVSAPSVLRRRRALADWLDGLLDATDGPPDLALVACAVADGLKAVGATVGGAAELQIARQATGYRIVLESSSEDAGVFAAAFEQTTGEISAPRALISAHVDADLPERPRSVRSARHLRRLLSRARPASEMWFAVPTVLGRNARALAAYEDAWHRWVGPGRVLRTATPEGTGILAAVHGTDPFAADSVVRTHWT